MRLTKFNPETGLYEYHEKAKTQAEFNEQRKAVIQRLGEFEENAECRVQNAEWISVEERLPEPNVECIVAAKVGNRMVTDFAERVHCYDFRTKESYYEWEIMHDWDEGEGCEINYWMPLPNPPKMKGADDEQIEETTQYAVHTFDSIEQAKARASKNALQAISDYLAELKKKYTEGDV